MVIPMKKTTVLAVLSLSLICCLTACESAPKESKETANKYEPVIQKWVEADAVNPPPKGAVVFIGSSSIRLWKTLEEDFSQYDVIQRGFGGSTFADANLYIDQIVTPYDPAAVVVFEGSNDIASGKTGEEVFEDYKQFVRLIRKGSGRWGKPVPILFIGITPAPSRWNHWPQVKIANQLIREYTEKHDGLHYIDTVTPILATAPEPGGPPSHDLFIGDLLHLSPKGYQLWVEVITPQLQAACPPTKDPATGE